MHADGEVDPHNWNEGTIDESTIIERLTFIFRQKLNSSQRMHFFSKLQILHTKHISSVLFGVKRFAAHGME